MASLVTYTCLAGATRPHFQGRTGPVSQAPVRKDVCLVSNRVWQASLLSIAALCDGLQAR